MKTETKIVMLVITVLAFVGVVAFAATPASAVVVSNIQFSGTGIVNTNSVLTDSTCGSMDSMVSSTFGRTALDYTSTVSGTQTARGLVSTAGVVTMSDTVSSTMWMLGNTTCNGEICTTTPSTYTSVTAGSKVTLYGPGTVSTASLVDPTMTGFALSAVGTGDLNQYSSALSMTGTVTGSGAKCTDLIKTTYDERVSIGGKFNYQSLFTYS